MTAQPSLEDAVLAVPVIQAALAIHAVVMFGPDHHTDYVWSASSGSPTHDPRVTTRVWTSDDLSINGFLARLRAIDEKLTAAGGTS